MRPPPLSDISECLGKVHVGDAAETMNRMPAGSIGLIVTSPPYNLRNSTGHFPARGGMWPKPVLIDGYATHDDAMPHDL